MLLLLFAVVAAPVLAFWPDGEQDPDQWQKHVKNACEARRYGTRLAAARRVATAGAAAVPAIKAYSHKKGRNAVPISLVDLIANSKTTSPETVVLLQAWAEDLDFYWRSSALRGLALRAQDGSKATAGDNVATAKQTLLFDKYRDDPAWKMRTNARLGLAIINAEGTGADKVFALAEADPRARVRRTPPLQPLIDALADQRTFLGIPWGARLGLESSKALNVWLGADFPELVGGDYGKSIAAILAAAKRKSGQELTEPKAKVDQESVNQESVNQESVDQGSVVIGGFAIASCKYGDQFVQWQADGTLKFGIDGARTAKLPTGQWQELLQQRTVLALEKNVGVVVCDKMQVVLVDPKTRIDVAPGSLPSAASEWLKRLALTLEEANETELSANLRRGFSQFEGR
ncbi:MAG TPA: hypothetical protein EYP98_09955 [Planctomycetes bacterium]|nr:hypothetical protein [Planctomycetota bacterium]